MAAKPFRVVISTSICKSGPGREPYGLRSRSPSN